MSMHTHPVLVPYTRHSLGGSFSLLTVEASWLAIDVRTGPDEAHQNTLRRRRPVRDEEDAHVRPYVTSVTLRAFHGRGLLGYTIGTFLSTTGTNAYRAHVALS